MFFVSMGKQKYSTDFKRQVVLHYLSGHDGAKKTAALFGIDHGAVRRWTEHWKVSGEAGLTITTKAYSAEFKEEVLLWMKQNCASSRKAAATFKIAAACTVSRWERLYREGGIMALRDKRTERTMTSEKTPPGKPLTAPYPTFHSAEEELEYLRAENAYLKKLHALAREKQQKKQKSFPG
ncbi:transcriptional regulator [Aeromonas caviae]|uniref:Transcriptional regulator n=1 Tax=Aeromonas caviae TaxID=648 RepID=A0AAI9KQS9_AERCA|nr:transcriptional regulator [Aeromonas caviae]